MKTCPEICFTQATTLLQTYIIAGWERTAGIQGKNNDNLLDRIKFLFSRV
jgi:hypothetical protein